jgi:hypothetical protein
VLKYASALLQREYLVRNVIVDTLSACVFDACEAEGKLEAPSTSEGAVAPTKKKRLPFMQKVIGDALAETFAEVLVGGDTVGDADLIDMVALLQKQKAPSAVIADALRRLRESWLSVPVSTYLASVAESKVPPAVVYNEAVATVFGVDYFLPPLPAFTADDERHLSEAIEIDQLEAGKETVFAANLKKALKLVRQVRLKAAQAHNDDDAPLPLAAPLASFLAQQSAPSSGAAPSPPFERDSLVALETFLDAHNVVVPRPPGDPPMPPEVQVRGDAPA